jgi:addiction module RelB/DinJ family antitoxin
MARTSSIYTRVEPEIKAQAEQILTTLGIPVTSAINLFLRQVVMQKGIPFDVKIPPHPLDMSKMTKEELDAEIQKGWDSARAGRTIPANKVRKKMEARVNNR